MFIIFVFIIIKVVLNLNVIGNALYIVVMFFTF